MPIDDQRRFVVPDTVLHRSLEDEVVLLDLGAGKYFSLDSVGAAAWDLMASGKTMGELIATLLGQFEVDEATLRADLQHLVSQLVERRLIDVE